VTVLPDSRCLTLYDENTVLAAFVAGCPLDQLYVSAVTLAEIGFGIELAGEPSRS
jgi:hypothetical protein